MYNFYPFDKNMQIIESEIEKYHAIINKKNESSLQSKHFSQSCPLSAKRTPLDTTFPLSISPKRYVSRKVKKKKRGKE